MSATFLFEPTPHEAASEWIADKTLTNRAIFDGLLPELRGRAFLITGVEDADVLQRVRDLLAEVPRGEDWEKTRERIAGEISPFLGEEEAGARAELLLRMHVNQAYEAMNWRELQENQDIFPYYEYLTIEDERVRPAHKALHGVIAPAGSSFWQNHWPPWEWGCRCSVRGVQDWEADEIRAREKDLGPDQRRIMGGAMLKKLEEGDLVRGPNQIFDVRTPSERGQTGSYEWHPSTMRIPMETLRERYDPEVWAAFESWAARTEISGRLTVWDWINGEGTTLHDPRVIRAIEAAVTGAERIETGHVVARDGRILLTRQGTEGELHFTADEMRLMRDATLAHNHPSGQSFSDRDLVVAYHGIVAEIRVVGRLPTGERVVYRLSSPSGWAPSKWPYIMERYYAIVRETGIELDARIARGQIARAVAEHEHPHIVMERLAAEFPRDFKYGREALE